MQNAETVLGVLRERPSRHRSLESPLRGNSHGGFGGRPRGKGPTPQAPRRAAHPSFDVKNTLGVGQARNRTQKAVERTVPFGLFCHSILIIWYALHGHHHTDTQDRRKAAPWYTTKTEPSTLDMLTTLRRQIIAARFMPSTPRPATTQETLEVQHAWALAAA
jgi:hypothetical protein